MVNGFNVFLFRNIISSIMKRKAFVSPWGHNLKKQKRGKPTQKMVSTNPKRPCEPESWSFCYGQSFGRRALAANSVLLRGKSATGK